MCELKKAIWREYDAEIKEALSSSEKVRDISIPTTEKERNYLKRMNLPDARTYILQSQMQNHEPHQGKPILPIQK